MAQRFPIKNIDQVLVDIRKPKVKKYQQKPLYINLSGVSAQPLMVYEHKKYSILPYVLILLFFIFSFSYLLSLNFNQKKFVLNNEFEVVLNNYNSVFYFLKSFDFEKGLDLLMRNQMILNDLKDDFNKYKFAQLNNVLDKFLNGFSVVFEKVDQVNDFNKSLIEIFQILTDLKKNGFLYFQNDGGILIKKLERLDYLLTLNIERLKDIQKNSTFLKNLSEVFAKINNKIIDKYLSYNNELYQWQDFLSSLVKFLKDNEEFNFLIFFQNSAEIRPTGGFIGSYGEVLVKNAKLESINVRDIYDPDGWFEENIIPPEPIKVTHYRWKIRDANWFFDFPLSAKKVISFFEKSKMYQEKNINFAGALAVNINFLKRILNLTGPIKLVEFNNLVIDENNFLFEIQREVEAGESKEIGEPKRILKILTPILIEKINNLDETNKNKLFEIVAESFKNKDLMVYFKDKNIQKYLDEYNLSGKIYDLPKDFFGSYLAVVNANIEGGKSDAFIDQSIDLQISLDTKGNSFNTLFVTRTHNGHLQKDFWWKRTNQDYLQVFVNENSNLVFVSGNSNMPKKFKEVNYTALDYTQDKDVYDFEKNSLLNRNYKTWVTNFLGKTIFGTWLITPAGKTSKLELRYEFKNKEDLNDLNNKEYNFIYQKQSGVETKLNVKIYAPYGYYWQENGAPVFNFSKENVNKLEFLKLTLRKY